jgi:L-lysine exporter family protein LysE/ArgO
VALAFGKGLALGLALITPIGAQNLFVLEQGLRRGLRRALPAVLAGSGGLRRALVAVGVVFLVGLGLRSLLARPEPVDVRSGGSVVARTIGVSLLNPHAVLDTVGVIGGAVAAQAAAHRLEFAAGAATASWLWFLALAATAALLQARLSARGRLWIARLSGAAMLLFAALLAREILR